MSVKPERADPAESPPAVCRRFLLSDVAPGERVLDVGCGKGELLRALGVAGCQATGVEIDPTEAAICRQKGLDVRVGRAEALPFADGTFDRVTCSVVLPYTDEERAVAEWARVLKPRGTASLTCHGLGYALAYAALGPGLGRRVYGARMIANTWVYRASGRRLPGFWGDTLCQSSGRLRGYYDRLGLRLERELWVGAVVGAPLFLCQRVTKGG
jgi:SAM-dependent methyltransferase